MNRHRHTTKIAVRMAALLASLAMAGCAGTIDSEKPVGIGSSPNTLKSSPCVCIEVPNAARG